MASDTLQALYKKAIKASWVVGYQFAHRINKAENAKKLKAERLAQVSNIYNNIQIIKDVVEKVTANIVDSTTKNNARTALYNRLCVYLITNHYPGKVDFQKAVATDTAWDKRTLECAPASEYLSYDVPTFFNKMLRVAEAELNFSGERLVGYWDSQSIPAYEETKHLNLLLQIAVVTYKPEIAKAVAKTKENTAILAEYPEYTKFIKAMNNLIKDDAGFDRRGSYSKTLTGVDLAGQSISISALKRSTITDTLGFSSNATDLLLLNVLLGLFELIEKPSKGQTVAGVITSFIDTRKTLHFDYIAAKEKGIPDAATVYPQTPKTPTQIVKDLTTIVAKGDLEGSKAALVQIDGLLNSYSGEGGANKALRSQLIDLRNKFQYAVNKRTQELGGTPPPVTPPVNKTTNPNNQGTKTDVKNAVEAAYKQGGVEAAITKARGYNSPPISQAVTVDFYEEDEPIEVQPATARIILKDPLTDTPNLDYPTNLIDTDLNDFRRAQLVLPYSVGEGSAKLSWFKLSTNPAVSGITEQSTGGPTLENIFGNNASYNQFFLKGLEESRNEKFQLVDTPAQGQTLFSFGEKPEFWTIRGQLLNDSINDWTNKFRVAWINHMRLNQLTRTGRYMEVHIPAIRLMFTCYPVALSLSHADESETVTNFAMMVFKRSEKVLPNLSYTKQDAKAAMLNTLLSLDNKSVLLEVPTKGNLTPIDPATGKPFANSSAEPTTSKEATTRTDRATRGGESGADGSGKVFPPRPPQEQLAPFQKKLDNRRS